MSLLHLKSFGRWHWVAFFGAVLLGWWGLFQMAIPADLRALQAIYGGDLIEALCSGLLGPAGFWSSFAMWGLMSAAMMAPTAVPAFVTYDRLPPSDETSFARLVGGYLLAWLGFSALAGAGQSLLVQAGLVSAIGQSLSVWFSAALLVLAGLYQFSPLKMACVNRCRAPLPFFMQYWSEGAFRMGLRIGLDCIGCCWALMLLGFVGGMMNLGFMGLAMLIMTLEKLPDFGRYLTAPLGAALLVAGLALPFI